VGFSGAQRGRQHSAAFGSIWQHLATFGSAHLTDAPIQATGRGALAGYQIVANATIWYPLIRVARIPASVGLFESKPRESRETLSNVDPAYSGHGTILRTANFRLEIPLY